METSRSPLHDPGHVNRAPEVALPHLPLIEASAALAPPVKPTWRGWIHAGAAPLALTLGIVLVAAASGFTAKASCTVFVVTSLILFGMSALYHRLNWSPGVKQVLQRVDHANIFLLIAGTYTPIAVICLPPAKATLLL